jgi:hypothetical protein
VASASRRRVLWYALFVAPSFLCLGVVLAAIVASRSPHRLWPIAGFLMVWAGSAGYVTVARRVLRLRAFRVRHAPVPRGVRLKKPLWIRLDETLTVVTIVATVATIVAAIGFPQVAFGILLVALLGAFGAASFAATSGLTFEEAGLRIHLGRAHCLVPWTSIRAIEPIGPDNFQMIQLGIDGIDRVLDSISPPTPRNRKRAEGVFGGAAAARGEILLETWTAGLDGQTLARAIREGMDGRPDPAN